MAREIRMIEDFKDLVSQNALYVDKSNFIKEVLSKDVVLYTRPRRFGKTLNMHMLYYFFSNQEDSYELFKDLNIAKDAESMKHLNQYPVINISLKNVAGNSFEEAVVNYRHELSKFVSLNSYLLDNCDDYDRKDFLKYLNENADRLELEWSLRNLTRIMYRHFDKYVMVLIDDYDIPLHYAYKHGCYPAF